MSIHRLRQESLELLEKLRTKTKEIRTQIRGAGVNLQGVNIDSYLDLVVEFLNGTKETFQRDEERIKRFKGTRQKFTTKKSLQTHKKSFFFEKTRTRLWKNCND